MVSGWDQSVERLGRGVKERGTELDYCTGSLSAASPSSQLCHLTKRLRSSQSNPLSRALFSWALITLFSIWPKGHRTETALLLLALQSYLLLKVTHIFVTSHLLKCSLNYPNLSMPSLLRWDPDYTFVHL